MTDRWTVDDHELTMTNFEHISLFSLSFDQIGLIAILNTHALAQVRGSLDNLRAAEESKSIHMYIQHVIYTTLKPHSMHSVSILFE